MARSEDVCRRAACCCRCACGGGAAAHPHSRGCQAVAGLHAMETHDITRSGVAACTVIEEKTASELEATIHPQLSFRQEPPRASTGRQDRATVHFPTCAGSTCRIGGGLLETRPATHAGGGSDRKQALVVCR